jgi:hypothetical protein
MVADINEERLTLANYAKPKRASAQCSRMPQLELASSQGKTLAVNLYW